MRSSYAVRPMHNSKLPFPPLFFCQPFLEQRKDGKSDSVIVYENTMIDKEKKLESPSPRTFYELIIKSEGQATLATDGMRDEGKA